MSDKLTSINGKSRKDNPFNEFVDQVQGMKTHFSTMMEAKRMDAQLDREYYHQLVKEGFSKEEALELVKATKQS